MHFKVTMQKKMKKRMNENILNKKKRGRSQDGGGIGWETTFTPTNSSKEQLNAEKISQNNF